MDLSEVEMAILGVFYRAEKYDVDRAPNRSVSSADPVSGLVASANDLAPRASWTSGTELAMSICLSPKTLAAGMIYRINDHKEETSLSFIPPHNWTDDEIGVVRDLESRIRITAIRMAQRGLINDRPEVGMDGEAMPLKDDGSPFVFKITYKGLNEARTRIKGTKYDRRGPSVWDSMTESDKVKSQAQWARNY